MYPANFLLSTCFLAVASCVWFDAAFALYTFIKASRPFILQFYGGFSSRLWICKAAPERHGQQSGTEISILLFLNQTRHIGFYYRECSYLRMNSAGEQQAGRQAPRKTGTSEREAKGKKDRKRQDGMFVRLLNTLQNSPEQLQLSNQTLLLFSEHVASTYESNNSTWNPADSVVMRSFRAGAFCSAASLWTGFTKQPGDRWRKSVMCSFTGIRWERGDVGGGQGGSKCAHCFMFTMMGTDPMRQCLVWTNHSDETQGQRGIYWP